MSIRSVPPPLVLALAGLGGSLAVSAAAAQARPPARELPNTLAEIQAAHHPGYDLLVFEFRRGLPDQRSARYVPRIIADPSGKHISVVGSALLRFGVGLARKEPFRMFTLSNPSRVVIDVQTPYRTSVVHDYLLNSARFRGGRPPFTTAVDRPVITPAVASGALQRLFAGPTRAELARGLRLIASQATGFKNLTISDHVARVQLTGGCSSRSSTFTIASEIMPTLRQFSSVRWVKIYDPAGHTERPAGHSDSNPVCLEP